VAVDDHGDVLGYDELGNPFLLPTGGQSTNLGAVAGAAGTYVTAIDPAGATIVGYGLSTTNRQGATRGLTGSWSVPTAFGTQWVSPTAINSARSIVGSLQVGTPAEGMVATLHAFLFAGTTVQDLGTLGGQNSTAYGISASGSVVGIAQTAAEDTHAFLYSGGTMHDLGTLSATNSAAYAVNSAGTVVGVSETSAGEGHAFVYQGGAMQDLNLDQARSEARGIADSGTVAGNWLTSMSIAVPFLWLNGSVSTLTMADTSGHPWMSIRMEAMSPGGLIVGWGRPSGAGSGTGATHCVLWRAP
jgi:probable HAF family extracellular repeat protein